MKVLMVINRYYPARGGAEHVARKIAEGMVKKGHEVTVLCSNFSKSSGGERIAFIDKTVGGLYVVSDKKIENGVRVMARRGVRFGRDPFTFISGLGGLVNRMQKDFDVVHTFTYGYHTSWMIALMKWMGFLKLPIVFSPHYALVETVPKWLVDLFDATLGKLTIRMADKIVLLTGTYREFFEKVLGSNVSKGELKKRIVVIPPVVDPIPEVSEEDLSGVMTKFGIPRGRKIVLSLSRLVEYKGVQFLVKAFGKLKQDGKLDKLGAHLVVAGTGDYVKELGSLVKDFAVEDYVTFTGEVTEAEKAALYRLAGLFALLSYSGESFGVTLAEAMSCEVPVLGSNMGAIPAVIEGYAGGKVVDPKDVNSVAINVESMIHASRKVVKEKGSGVMDRFNHDVVVAKWEDLYLS